MISKTFQGWFGRERTYLKQKIERHEANRVAEFLNNLPSVARTKEFLAGEPEDVRNLRRTNYDDVSIYVAAFDSVYLRDDDSKAFFISKTLPDWNTALKEAGVPLAQKDDDKMKKPKELKDPWYYKILSDGAWSALATLMDNGFDLKPINSGRKRILFGEIFLVHSREQTSPYSSHAKNRGL